MKLVVSYVIDVKGDGRQPAIIEAVEKCLTSPFAFPDGPEKEDAMLLCNIEGHIMVGDVLGEISDVHFSSPSILASQIASLRGAIREATASGSAREKKLGRLSKRLAAFEPSQKRIDASISGQPTTVAVPALMRAATMLGVELHVEEH